MGYMLPFPWLEAQAPVLFALSAVTTLFEGVIFLACGLIAGGLAVIPVDSTLTHREKILLARFCVFALIATPLVWVFGLYVNAVLYVFVGIPLLIVSLVRLGRLVLGR